MQFSLFVFKLVGSKKKPFARKYSWILKIWLGDFFFSTNQHTYNKTIQLEATKEVKLKK